MADKIIVNLDTIQVIADKLRMIEQEIDDITTELFYIKGAASDGWSGEAKDLFTDNCHQLRQKGVEVYYHLQKNRESLQSAAGLFVATEQKNKNINQDLSADNIFV